MTIKEFFSFKTNKYFWLNLIGMTVVALVLLFGVLKWLDVYTRHGEAVVVPDAKGMMIDEAEMLFRNHGLVCVVSDSSYVKSKPAGCVLDLSPAAGQKVKVGRTIYVTINTLDVPLRPIPDVADNSSVRQAQAKILAAGFKLSENEEIAGEKDWVYGVKYKGRILRTAEEVPVGSALTLLVGNGGQVDALEGDSIEMSEGAAEPGGTTTTSTDDSWF